MFSSNKYNDILSLAIENGLSVLIEYSDKNGNKEKFKAFPIDISKTEKAAYLVAQREGRVTNLNLNYISEVDLY